MSRLQNRVQSAQGLLPAWGINVPFSLPQLRALPSEKRNREFKSTAEMSWMRMMKVLLFAGRTPQRTSFHHKNSFTDFPLNASSDQLLQGALAVQSWTRQALQATAQRRFCLSQHHKTGLRNSVGPAELLFFLPFLFLFLDKPLSPVPCGFSVLLWQIYAKLCSWLYEVDK